MAPTNSRSQEHSNAPSLPDPLQHLQRVNNGKSTAITGLLAAKHASYAPNRENWLAKLDLLQRLEAELALLPIGWGTEQKGPMLEVWQHHQGVSISGLQRWPGIRSVGARTGLLTGPLLAFDFDGATSLKLGLDPAIAGSWQVHRNTDPARLKVLFRPTFEQLKMLPSGVEFQGKTITAPKTDTAKGEALEVFFDGGRQVIILGEHPSSNGYYYWPAGMGPEQLTAPPADWWQFAIEIATTAQQRKLTGSKPSCSRNKTRRLNPCPICGRHDGQGGSALWCEQTQQGLILCMPGSTFSAEATHGPMRIGQVVDGWALVKRTPIGDGDVLSFKAHRPRGGVMDDDCSRLEYWSGEIEKLEELNCKWGEKAHNAMEIKNLCIGIGSDKELQNEEFIFLQEQLKKSLGCPKKVSCDLIDKSRLIASPPPPPPLILEDCIEATPRPIDLQAAEIILREKNDLITEKAWALFKYHEDLGFWLQWADTKAKNTAQEALQRLGVLGKKEGEWIFPHGSFSQVESTIKQLKVLTTGGVLGDPTPALVIVFRNGTFNLTTNKLEQHNPSNGATYGVAADYIKDSGCPPELEAIVERCYPPGALPIVQAIIRWLVDPTARYGQAFHIVGDSGTGKGLLIDFCRSLFPSNVTGQLLHPADLNSPEKIHQYVLGRRLLVFPDTPSALERRDGDNINLFYELVENKPVTTRKLFAGESEESQPMHCRFILGSIQPLELKNGRDGYLRRTLVLNTLPRQGEPDHSLLERLKPKGIRFDAIRAEAISWALTMSQDELNNVLNGNDPEGLLRDSAKDMAANSDTLSRWVDQCLIPSEQNLQVTKLDWDLMFECYLGWSRYNNSRHTLQRHRFPNALGTVLGPKRCLPRAKESSNDAKANNRPRQTLAQFYAGFMLIPGILSQGKDALSHPTSEDFQPTRVSSGGLEKIAMLDQAIREPLSQGKSALSHTCLRDCLRVQKR